ncbi:MAG: hypothetical protein JW857_10430 [Bacteroidales bacterium]|nr:hypothetical protein [Bacteroidales bacterium]
MKTTDKKTGIVTATVEQLKSIGISSVPKGAVVELYNIDKYDTIHGPGSKMRYIFEDLDYIIPTKWVV